MSPQQQVNRLSALREEQAEPHRPLDPNGRGWWRICGLSHLNDIVRSPTSLQDRLLCFFIVAYGYQEPLLQRALLSSDVLGQGPNYLPVGLLTAPQLGHAGRPYPQPMITLLVTLPLPILNDPIEGPGYATSCSRPSLRQAWVPCRLRHPRFLTAEQPGPQRLTGLSPLKGRNGHARQRGVY
jgi:hypothetical protein